MGWSSPSITDFSSPTDDAVSTPTMAVSTPLYDAAAFSTPTFWGAGGGGGDAFAELIDASASLIAWWSPNGEGAGNIADGSVAMPSMGSAANPDILCNVAVAGDWAFVADDIGTTPSLTTAVEGVNVRRKNPGPYDSRFCGIDSGTAISDTDYQSAFAIFKTTLAAWSPGNMPNYADIVTFYGTAADTSAPNYPADSLALRLYRVALAGQPWFGGNGWPGTWLPLGSAITVGQWWFLAWDHPSADPNLGVGTMNLYAIPVGGDWTADLLTGSGGFGTPNSGRGLTFGHETSNNAANDMPAGQTWRWGPIGVFSAPIGVGTSGTTLRTIFEAIS